MCAALVVQSCTLASIPLPTAWDLRPDLDYLVVLKTELPSSADTFLELKRGQLLITPPLSAASALIGRNGIVVRARSKQIG